MKPIFIIFCHYDIIAVGKYDISFIKDSYQSHNESIMQYFLYLNSFSHVCYLSWMKEPWRKGVIMMSELRENTLSGILRTDSQFYLKDISQWIASKRLSNKIRLNLAFGQCKALWEHIQGTLGLYLRTVATQKGLWLHINNLWSLKKWAVYVFEGTGGIYIKPVTVHYWAVMVYQAYLRVYKGLRRHAWALLGTYAWSEWTHEKVEERIEGV